MNGGEEKKKTIKKGEVGGGGGGIEDLTTAVKKGISFSLMYKYDINMKSNPIIQPFHLHLNIVPHYRSRRNIISLRMWKMAALNSLLAHSVKSHSEQIFRLMSLQFTCVECKSTVIYDSY